MTESAATASRITQRDLKAYLALADQAREINSRYENLRKYLLEQLEAKAEIQPGKLSAVVIESRCQRFSFDAIAEIRGRKFAEQLKTELPISISKSPKVIEAS